MTIHTIAPNSPLPSSKVLPGDTLQLETGVWTSPLDIRNIGWEGEARISVRPAPCSTVMIPQLIVRDDCSSIDILGFNKLLISDDVAGEDDTLVTIDGSYCHLAHCKISGLEEFQHANKSLKQTLKTALTVAPWAIPAMLEDTPNGIVIRGEMSTASHNQLAYLRYGIMLMGEYAEATQNQIAIISGDHIRGLANFTRINRNVLTRSFNINPNEHNDFIQLWNASALTPQTGTLEGIKVSGNILFNDSTESIGAARTQGIGCFDGAITSSEITGNWIATDHELGICIGRGHEVHVQKNIVVSPNDLAVKAGIHIGTRKPNQCSFNSAESINYLDANQAMEYKLTDCNTTREHSALLDTKTANMWANMIKEECA